jgi:hypothetical protein
MKSSRSSGTDEISSFHLKIVAKEVAPALTEMINTSLTTGNFPECFKTAKVTPIWKKKGKMSDKNMYRPISGLQTFGKFPEIVVDLQLRKFCERHGLFGANQHGFRKSRSCDTALIATYNGLRHDRMRKKWQGVVCFDLSAAYDTVKPEILLEKARILGFDKIALAWLTSYVIGRKQAVKIGNYMTQPINLECGIPQGSCCSCLLFILYVGDFELWTSASHSIYADDMMISASENNPEKVIGLLQKEAEGLLEFFASKDLICNSQVRQFSS